MTFIPETHSLLVSAAFLAAFALIALVTLWQVRDLGVYLWTASGLAGALYSTVSAGIALLVGLFVREAYRLGREQSLGNAKLLAV
jgi:hypothetical protein